jgi:methyl-accepting chemotaxis protein
MTTVTSTAPSAGTGLFADRVMLAAVGLSALAALVIGFQFDAMGLALGGALVFAGLAGMAYALAGGTLAGRLVVTFAQVALVALHIQLSRGMLEFHFGVFVTLALLMVYRDWRIVVWAAALFAVHHVLFDRLQAAGFGFYCTTQPDFARIVLHAAYVVIQTALETVLVVGMARAAREGEELTLLMSHVDRHDRIELDIGHLAVTSRGAKAFQHVLARVQTAVHTVQQSTGSIDVACTEIASGNQDLSMRTEQTASNLQQSVASISQLTGTVQQSADAARQASALAANAGEVAARGGNVVTQVVTTMDDIHTSSSRIADITSVIDGIAFQTNILALNAAVEAARAGEQGRGFAVVASEVRSLAQRSAAAAKEISGLIGSSVSKVESGARLVRDAGSTMQEIVAAVQKVNDVIGEISASAGEQATGIREVNTAVGQLEGMTQQNAALVEEAAAAAGSLREQSRRLVEAVSVFRVAQPA